MSRLPAIGLLVTVGITAFAAPSFAQGLGLEGLHEHRREGDRVCMVGHFHDGSGSGKERKRAEAEAIQSWSDFTAWEYGGHWGRYQLAANKSMSCSSAGGTWTCQTSARPCRAAASRPRSRSR